MHSVTEQVGYPTWNNSASIVTVIGFWKVSEGCMYPENRAVDKRVALGVTRAIRLLQLPLSPQLYSKESYKQTA